MDMNEQNDFDENTHFNVNFAAVLSQKDFLSVTRMLAADIMSTPYMSVGDFMCKLSDEELATLLDISEHEEHPRLDEILLISEMLASAEGLEGSTIETAHDRINQFCVFLVLESLKRKGLVKLRYENMSLGEDYKDKIIAEKP